MSQETKRHASFIPSRVAILKLLYEKGKTRFPEIKDHLQVDRNAVKKHLKKLENYVTTDEYGRFLLSPLGKGLIARYEADYHKIYKFLIEKSKPKIIQRRKKGALKIRSYRSVYDLIAMILGMKKDVITVTSVVREVSVSVARAQPIISFMKEKGLIKRVDARQLPEPYSNFRTRRYWVVTEKGRSFTQKYKELNSLIR